MTRTDTATPTGDVWLAFAADTDEEATHEANTYRLPDGRYEVRWYHNAVGQVRAERFDYLADAHEWLTTNGYADFSS